MIKQYILAQHSTAQHMSLIKFNPLYLKKYNNHQIIKFKNLNFASYTQGFTLIELTTCLIVVTIFMTVIFYAYQNTLLNHKINVATNEILDLIHLAQNTAITKNQTVAICSQNTQNYSNCEHISNWSNNAHIVQVEHTKNKFKKKIVGYKEKVIQTVDETGNAKTVIPLRSKDDPIVQVLLKYMKTFDRGSYRDFIGGHSQHEACFAGDFLYSYLLGHTDFKGTSADQIDKMINDYSKLKYTQAELKQKAEYIRKTSGNLVQLQQQYQKNIQQLKENPNIAPFDPNKVFTREEFSKNCKKPINDLAEYFQFENEYWYYQELHKCNIGEVDIHFKNNIGYTIPVEKPVINSNIHAQRDAIKKLFTNNKNNIYVYAGDINNHIKKYKPNAEHIGGTYINSFDVQGIFNGRNKKAACAASYEEAIKNIQTPTIKVITKKIPIYEEVQIAASLKFNPNNEDPIYKFNKTDPLITVTSVNNTIIFMPQNIIHNIDKNDSNKSNLLATGTEIIISDNKRGIGKHSKKICINVLGLTKVIKGDQTCEF